MKHLSLVAALLATGLPAQQSEEASAQQRIEAWLADLGSADRGRAAAAAQALVPHVAAQRAALERLLDSESGELRLTVVRLFLRAKELPSSGTQLRLLRDADAAVRETGVLLKSRLQPEGWVDELALLLPSERDPRVSRQILVGLGSSGDLAQVPVILTWMGGIDDDYLLGKATSALLALTGVDHGRDVEAWQKWWTSTGEPRLEEHRRKARGEVEQDPAMQPAPAGRRPVLPKSDLRR